MSPDEIMIKSCRAMLLTSIIESLGTTMVSMTVIKAIADKIISDRMLLPITDQEFVEHIADIAEAL